MTLQGDYHRMPRDFEGTHGILGQRHLHPESQHHEALGVLPQKVYVHDEETEERDVHVLGHIQRIRVVEMLHLT